MEQFYNGMMILNQDKGGVLFRFRNRFAGHWRRDSFLRRRAQSQKFFAGKTNKRIVCQRQN